MAGVKAHDFDLVKKQDAASVVGVDNAYITRAIKVLDADEALRSLTNNHFRGWWRYLS